MLCLLTATPPSVGCPYLKRILCTHVTWRRRSLLARHPIFFSCFVFCFPSSEFATNKKQNIIVVVIAIVFVVIIIIIIIIISFMQGIYTYIPETNYVPREYSVAAILLLLFMVLISLVSVLNLLYFYISTFRSVCAVPNTPVLYLLLLLLLLCHHNHHYHYLLYAGYLYLYS